jgi:hypothetical protein
LAKFDLIEGGIVAAILGVVLWLISRRPRR